MPNNKLVLICFILITSKISCQDCKVPGKQCQDDEDCCGGCCISNICTKTNELCTVRENPCYKHYCPPGLECYLYRPNCEGCDLTTDCRFQDAMNNNEGTY